LTFARRLLFFRIDKITRYLPGRSARGERSVRAGRRAMTMGRDLKKIQGLYDLPAREWAEAFSGEHEKKRSGAGKHFR